jgi:hypothetical protein
MSGPRGRVAPVPVRTLAVVGLGWLLATPPGDGAAASGVVRAESLPVAAASLSTARQASAAQPLSVEAIVERAGAYVNRFADVFSNVVVEERYVQDVSGTAADSTRKTGHRELRSDVLLLKVGGPLEWRPYRDVFEVDGKPVRDRDDRLMALFQRPSASSFQQAARIAQESARYNIGLTRRTINTPVLALLFLQQAIQPRFRFRLGRPDRATGADIDILEYREQTRPTLIRGLTADDDMDLVATGRFWIDRATGEVRKSELVVAVFGMRANLATSFQRDERLGIAVPADMREEYQLQRSVELQGPTNKAEGAPRVVHRIEQTTITGAATYSNFRHFEVTTDTAIAPAER